MPRRRRRLQWSLRSFIIFCLAAGMLLGWIGRKVYLASPTPVPLLGPITSAETGAALAAPTDDEILRAIKTNGATSGRASPLTSPDFNLLRVVKDKLHQRDDPARVYPLIGGATPRHRIYRCVFLGTYRGRPHCEIVYIDHNNLHLSGDQ